MFYINMSQKHYFQTLVCLICYLHSGVVYGEMVSMKIVHDFPNNGDSNFNGLGKPIHSLPLRMKPAGISGPDYLHHLAGKCFKQRDLKYEYVFCPFKNITQEDIETFYEPYKGVLGVWLDWEIQDNKFTAMRMAEGSACDLHNYRRTKVEINCGPAQELVSVTEPEKCNYLAKFETPEVCGTNAVVVYPRLSNELQNRWDILETDKINGYLTDKGYQMELERIFIDAGYVASSEVKSSLLIKDSVEKTKFCQDELAEAKQRIIELEEEIKMKEEIILEMERKII